MRFFAILSLVGLIATQAFGLKLQGKKISLSNLGVPTLIPAPNITQTLTRILGGVSVTSNKLFPFMAAIQSIDSAGNISFCGGSIIKPNVIVTAAHCLVK